jgi:FkbM family methyltransferase
MTLRLLTPLRSLLRRVIHKWQAFWDYRRGKFREYADRYKILRGATVVGEDIYGIRFVLYPFDRPNSRTLLRRSHDTLEVQLIPKLVRPGDTAVDVGANAGFYSVLLSRACGPTGKVWAFEPVPETYWRLRENLALNRCENVVTEETAISNAPGIAILNLFDSQFAEMNGFGVRVARDSSGKPILASRSISVQSQSLDVFCDSERIERIHFLKVDVEGFELRVFEGAERLLTQRRVDYICFEIGKVLLEAAGFTTSAVISRLAAHGYGTYRFDRLKNRFEGPLLDIYEPWANFFASHRNLSGVADINSIPRDRVLGDDDHKASSK